MPVQKQTQAGQRTRFKAFVAIGDSDGHLGLGVKCAKEVATAIRGAIILAKLSVVPVRRGYWGAKLGEPHTVPSKVEGKCASVYVKLIPACVYLLFSHYFLAYTFLQPSWYRYRRCPSFQAHVAIGRYL